MIKFIHKIDILYLYFFLLGFLTVLWVLLYWGMFLFNIWSLLIFVNVRNAQSITSKAFNQSEKSEANKTHIRLYPDNNICKLGLSWSYGSWNWKYICNQCLLSIMVRGQIPLMAGCTWYNIYQKSWPPRYIVESGVKYHNLNPNPNIYICVFVYVQKGSNECCLDIRIASLNPAHGEVYLVQHYVIKFVGYLLQADGFPRVLRFPPPIKLTAMIYM